MKKPEPRQKAYHRAYEMQHKLIVMNKYGGKCKGCGNDDLACLSIDHIIPISTEDIIKNDEAGIRFYRKLSKESTIRSDLQVLCMSCQLRKRIYGPDISLWSAKRDELEHDIKNLKVRNYNKKTIKPYTIPKSALICQERLDNYRKNCRKKDLYNGLSKNLQ